MSTWRSQTPETTRFKESRTETTKPYTQPANATFFTLLNRPTFNLPTQGTKQLYKRRLCLYYKRVYVSSCLYVYLNPCNCLIE